MKISEKLTDETLAYFRKNGWVKPNEEVSGYGKAGDGNMNFVVRVKTNKRSFIVKQSRPYVEKYPHVPAPIDRVEIENAFYEITSQSEFLAGHSPKIIDFDRQNFTLVMEDLGNGSDFSGMYSGQITITKNEVTTLVNYLLSLHSLGNVSFPDNSKMKALNHEHIFNYPFLEDNGFDLETVQKGLQALAMEYKTSEALKEKCNFLGQRYLQNGSFLLHGDFYPGSWFRVGNGLKIIDPEFAFLGDPEFDLAIMLAHFEMSEQKDMIQFSKSEYLEKRSLNEELLNQYMGVEILRRLFGLAQLPLTLSLEKKSEMAKKAASLILNN